MTAPAPDVNGKRGDAIPLTLTLKADGSPVDLTVYDTATVILRRIGSTPLELTGTIAPGTGGVVTIGLTSANTAVEGDYQGEVECLPGPHTYPSDGYFTVRLGRDLNPT